MKITFYGGAGEVGRSCFLLEDGENNLMLDCGIKLGEKTEYPAISDEKLGEVRNMVITHAHLDHSGYLPHVYAKGAKPKVFLTKPTRDLISVLLSDYRRIQKDDENIFKQKDVDAVLKSANSVEYNENTKSDFDFTLMNAGHILGSAMVRVNDFNLVYSGDICMRKTRVLEACERNISAETLIVESTYGGKKDVLPSFKDSSARLVASITKTLDNGGWVIIPCFAVGRAQEILLMLDDYMRSGVLAPAKIYVEGMINKTMRIYRHNAYYANDDIKKRILMSEDDPFKSRFFHQSRSKTREDVLDEPCIVVTTSGMLSGGPVLYYLERLGGDPKTKMIFVGYQAEGTLGRKIVDGEKKVIAGEKEVEIKMQVEQIRMSGHPDYNELLQFIKGVKGLKKVILVHGEKHDLKDALEKKYEVLMPKVGETLDV